ncbi:MAG: hypothetical protein J7K15_04585, partial [Deltaproteobacteria bacterium]|nr:hypothetical protein [Deltaproteobacteria bacterium]
MLFGLAQVAGASIPNHFTTTDGDSDVIDYSVGGSGGLADGWYFGVYDFGVNLPSPGPSLDLLLGSSLTSFQSAEFSVTQSGTGGTWVITVESGFNIGNSINIGNSDEFSFYFKDSSGNYYTDFDITSGGGDAYNFDGSSFNGGHMLGDDLNPVPLPGSAIFLFSGIMGLVAFGSRRKIMK